MWGALRVERLYVRSGAAARSGMPQVPYKGTCKGAYTLEASKPDLPDPSATDTRSGEACRKSPPATPEQGPTRHPIHLERNHRPEPADSAVRAHERTNSDHPRSASADRHTGRRYAAQFAKGPRVRMVSAVLCVTASMPTTAAQTTPNA